MKTVGCLLVILISAQAIQHLPTEKRYQYDYKSYIASGIPLQSNQRTGMGIWSKINLEYKSSQHNAQHVVFNLEAPVIRHIDVDRPEDVLPVDRVPELREIISSQMFNKLPSDIEETLLDYLQKPVTFSLDVRSGITRDLMAVEEEPEWTLNIKRAIISQLILPSIDGVKTVVEETVLGEDCTVNYDIVTLPNSDKMNVTKTYTLENCRKPVNFTDALGVTGQAWEPTSNGLQVSIVTKAHVNFNGRRCFVDSAVCEGRYSFTPVAHGEATTYTRQEFTYISDDRVAIELSKVQLIKRGRSLISNIRGEGTTMIDLYTDILPENRKLEMIITILKNVYNEVESEIDPTFEVESTEEMVFAVKLMRTLREPESFVSLVDCATQIQQQPMRRMIMTAITSCGAPALVKSLPKIKTKVTTGELNRIITTLPLVMVPSKDTITTLKTLYATSKSESTGKQLLLAIGSQVHSLCEPKQSHQIRINDVCTRQFVSEMAQFFTETYVKVHEQHKLIALKSIGNSGLPVTRFLTQLIRTTDMHTELRVNAIFAMRRMEDLEQIKKALLPVFRNEMNYFPVELRIAAFDILLERIPTSEMLSQLASGLNEEADRQLGNYVYSYLKSTLSIPTIFTQTRNLTIAAQNLLPTLKRFEDGMWFSNNWKHLIRVVSARMGNYFQSSQVFTHGQALPRSMNLRLIQSLCDYYVSGPEVGFRFEGLDTLVKNLMARWLGENGNSESIFSGKWKQELQHIQFLLKEEIEPRVMEETKGYIFLKYLGEELGVFTVEDILSTFTSSNSDNESVYGLEKRLRYFDIVPIGHLTLKIPTPMGVAAVVELSATTMFSLHSDRVHTTEDDVIVKQNINPRILFKQSYRIGTDMGLVKTGIAQCHSIRTITPVTVIVSKEGRTGRVVYEVILNKEDPNYKSGIEGNLRLVDITTEPCKHVELIHLKDNTYTRQRTDITLNPLLFDTKVEAEIEGLKFVVQKCDNCLTILKPVAPFFCGGQSLKVELTSEVLPVGVKVDYEGKKITGKEHMLDTIFSLNPRIATLKKEVEITGKINLKKEEPLFALEVTPKWIERTFRFFFDFNILKGQFNPIMSWLEAGEEKTEKLVETLTKIQFGWDTTYNQEKQDVLVKTTLRKSDLQKMMEVEDIKFERSDCYRCEQDIKQGIYATIACNSCTLKRSWLSQLESKLFLNSEKMNPIADYLMPYLTYYMLPHYNTMESHKVQMIEHQHLINSERSLINTHMRQAFTTGKLDATKVIHDIHPYYTEWNITFETRDMSHKFTGFPLFPAHRRMYNLPLNRLTDVAADRVQAFDNFICILDARDTLKTFQGKTFNLTKESDCEQLLAKDCTKDKEFEVTTRLAKDKRRVLKINLADSVIVVEPTKTEDRFLLKINNVVQKWETMERDSDAKVITTAKIQSVLQPLVTPRGTDKRARVFIKPLTITIDVTEDMATIVTPFWYKNQLCGLCGDGANELVLPDQTAAPTLDSFIRAYSSTACRMN